MKIPPQKGDKILSRHPFAEQRRAYVTPHSVESLYRLYWADGKIQEEIPTLKEVREYAKNQIRSITKRYYT